MLNAKEAYEIVRKEYPDSILSSCLDFGKFYVFFVRPFYTSNETYYTGTVFDAVSKSDGNLFKYDITSDIDAYERSIEVKINTVYDLKIN